MDDANQQLLEQFRTYLEEVEATPDSADRDGPDLFSPLAELMDDAKERLLAQSRAYMDDAKERLLEQSRAYLEEVEAKPDSTDRDGPDLFSLLAELAALKNEVKIESKQIKVALEQFRDLFDTLRQSNERLSAELERRQREDEQTERTAERAMLLELLELRDRLHSGHAHASRYRPGWLARLAKANEFVTGMAQGMEMNLRRADDILARRDVHPITSVGQPFDPKTMTAVEVAADLNHTQGEVLTNVRTGYLRGEELLRTAEVIVNNIKDTPN